MTDRPDEEQAEHLLRELAPQVLAAVMRRFHDFAAAEDAVREALIAAALQWPRGGLPANPRGWLIHVAACRMTDYLRSEEARRRRESASAAQSAWPPPDAGAQDEAGQDDTLNLFFASLCALASLREIVYFFTASCAVSQRTSPLTRLGPCGAD